MSFPLSLTSSTLGTHCFLFQSRGQRPQHIKEMHGITRVSVERVASGRGLVNVYDFLSKKYSERVDKVVDEGEPFPRTNCVESPPNAEAFTFVLLFYCTCISTCCHQPLTHFVQRWRARLKFTASSEL